MSLEPQPISPMFRIDVSSDSDPAATSATPGSSSQVMVDLLKQLVIGQQQQNRMLESLVSNQETTGGGRNDDLTAWKDANPELAGKCRNAAETLSRVQSQFLESLVDEVNDNEEYLVEGDYMMNEFIDRFGPRMAHLNGVLQVLAQLGSEPVDTF